MKILPLILGILLFYSIPEKKIKEQNITCYVEGLKNDSAIILFMPVSNRDIEIMDTVHFVNGRLEYNYPVSELHEVMIIPFDLIYEFSNGARYPLPASKIRFFIDSSDKISIDGRIQNRLVDFEAKGNALSEQLTVARKMKIPLFRERIDFEFEYNSKDKKERNQMDEDNYWKLRGENNRKYEIQSISYIENNPNAEYSARLLLEIPDKEKATTLFNTFHEPVKNSYYGTIAEDLVNGWLLTTPGLEFPDIIDKTIDGTDFKLSNLRDKYVLLDFWGSWCKPCLEETPRLIKIQERYKDKLEIVGIACKDNRTRLLKTIKNKQIGWTQIIEGQTRDTKYSNRFGITGFPTKILIDKEGKIIKVYNGLDDSLYDDLAKVLIN